MPLEKLDLPAILRAASELLEATTSYRPEDHPEIIAAQAAPAEAPEPSIEAQLRWHAALGALLDAANRLKVALGATGELKPGRLCGSNLPAAWNHFDSNFANVDHPRAARFGLLRIARAAAELSGYAIRLHPPHHMRERGLSFLERGTRLVWPSMTEHERDEVRHLLPALRSAFGWSGSTDAVPPVWVGPPELNETECYGMYDRHSGYYASTREDLEEQQTLLAAINHAQHANSRPPATAGDQVKPRSKRSTQPGEARAKIIAALTKHHRYDDGGALNLEPIGNNKLAELAEVDKSTVSDFIADAFESRNGYLSACRSASQLAVSLRILNGELSPRDLPIDPAQFADTNEK